ncbi:hypothetical protein V497_00664 [Pseudogymnoascus sp. VKM F-4516 (FW-969)]|nr:hypothetical protein V497_00664 [Pseudogymnoascus sp. VKM F-4516 (FW-969)]
MDSEDDDDDDLNTQRPSKSPPQPPTKPPASKATTPTKPTAHQTTEILLVDNLTTLITTLFALTSPSAAHALLSQLSRTLATLTRSSSLTVFLLNTLVVKPPKFRQGMEGQQPEQQREKRGSVFRGMKATPSLGMVFENFVDLHLLAHRLPRGVGDAEGVYGVELAGTGEEGKEDGGGSPRGGEGRGGRNIGGGNGESIRFANVVEVLKDECPNLERWEGVGGEERPGRWVGREKRWAVFKIVEGVGLEDDEFRSE